MKTTCAEIKIQESGFLEKGRGQDEAVYNEEFYSSTIEWKSCRAETKFSICGNDLICNQTVASAASWESRAVIVLSSPQVWVHGIGAGRIEELNKSSLSLIRGSVMCYFSFLFCQLLLRVLFKSLWSLNSLLAGKKAQIHYNTLFTTGFSQLFMALNYGIHVFESVFKEGLNGLFAVHWCSRVWQRILI